MISDIRQGIRTRGIQEGRHEPILRLQDYSKCSSMIHHPVKLSNVFLLQIGCNFIVSSIFILRNDFGISSFQERLSFEI